MEYLGKFLLLERQLSNGPMFVLPGGKVERFDEHESEIVRELKKEPYEYNDNDVLLNTLRREVYEELQLVLPRDIDYFSSSFYVKPEDGQESSVIDVVFYTQLRERPELVVDGKEVTSYTWMDQKEILASPKVHGWLKKALKVFDRVPS